jgi:predicted RNA-binding protein with PUA domain
MIRIKNIIQRRQNKYESEPRNNRQSKREEVKEGAKVEAPEVEEAGEGLEDAGEVVVEAA